MKQCKIMLALAATILLQACSNGDEAANTAVTDANDVEAHVAGVYIISPTNGSTVTSPVTVEFGIRGFSLAPAGTYEEGTGHHHLLVDTSLPALDAAIPSDPQHLHFGKGQNSAVLELEPGDHTLQLLLGDGNHMPHSTALISDPIVITVVEEAVE